MDHKCLECGEVFSSQKSLHCHIKKHDMFLGDYYVKHFKKRNKLTGELMQFRNVDDYLEKDFSNINQLEEWCEKNPIEARRYILELLDKRMKKKLLNLAPGTVELFTSCLPNVDFYKKHYGTYRDACDLIQVKPRFTKNLPQEFSKDWSNIKIFVDTREQRPLNFKNSESLKLDIGDYAVGGEFYNYTHVDRKSFGDFCGTMSTGFKRFCRELARCRSIGCYLFIVIEADLYNLENENKKSPKRFDLAYIFHNMRETLHEYGDCCQYVFSGSRSNSEKIIPKILGCGKSLWDVDVQYFINKELNYGLGSR